jgi:hypothetical protein
LYNFKFYRSCRHKNVWLVNFELSSCAWLCSLLYNTCTWKERERERERNILLNTWSVRGPDT